MDCVRCHVALEEGFVPEFRGGGVVPAVWHPGAPTAEGKSLLQWLASPAGVTIDPAATLLLEAHRCPSCGRVELVARNPVPTALR